MNEEDADRFVEALLKLKEPYQSVAALRLEYELSYDEIAEVLELPVDRVVEICHEAQRQLRDLL